MRLFNSFQGCKISVLGLPFQFRAKNAICRELYSAPLENKSRKMNYSWNIWASKFENELFSRRKRPHFDFFSSFCQYRKSARFAVYPFRWLRRSVLLCISWFVAYYVWRESWMWYRLTLLLTLHLFITYLQLSCLNFPNKCM